MTDMLDTVTPGTKFGRTDVIPGGIFAYQFSFEWIAVVIRWILGSYEIRAARGCSVAWKEVVCLPAS